MDGFYSSWATRVPDGFSDGQIAALQRTAPYLAVAIKSVSLARMTGTLMETYLGRDAGRRVLGGRIVRGIAERIDAVVWFREHSLVQFLVPRLQSCARRKPSAMRSNVA
jgi:adenylate cyclase